MKLEKQTPKILALMNKKVSPRKDLKLLKISSYMMVGSFILSWREMLYSQIIEKIGATTAREMEIFQLKLSETIMTEAKSKPKTKSVFIKGVL